MNKRQDTKRGLVDGVLSKVGKINKPAGSGVHSGGDSAVQADVRVDPVDTTFKPVTVEVYQPGTDVLSFEIQGLCALAGFKVSSQLQDSALFDSYVKDSARGLRGINDVAAFEQQIVEHGCEREQA